MISIVDADELRNVLRPTVYRPNSDELRRGDAVPVKDRSTMKAEMSMRMGAESPVAR
jgi:hypothetical protein